MRVVLEEEVKKDGSHFRTETRVVAEADIDHQLPPDVIIGPNGECFKFAFNEGMSANPAYRAHYKRATYQKVDY